MEMGNSFLTSCENKNLEKVREYMEQGLNVNIKCDNNFALKYAITTDDSGLQLLDLLLTSPNIDVNMKDGNQRTALMLSCISGHIDITRRLIKARSIEINCQDYGGETALMLSFVNGDKDTTKKLLSMRGLDVNCKDNCGQTALMLSSINGDEDTIEKLLSMKDIDVNCQDKYGQTALMLSCINGHPEITKRLLAVPGVNINCQDNDGETAAMFAVLDNNQECFEQLTYNDEVDWNLQDTCGMTVVMWAIDSDEIKYLEMIQNKNVRWNLKDYYGDTAFVLALKNNRSEFAQFLLQVPDLEIDIYNLKAVMECTIYISKKMINDQLCSQDIDNVINLYVYAYCNTMRNIARVLIPDHEIAVKRCRELAGEMMTNDNNIHPEENMTELVYALKTNLDNLSLILASSVTIPDILLLCKIYMFN